MGTFELIAVLVPILLLLALLFSRQKGDPVPPKPPAPSKPPTLPKPPTPSKPIDPSNLGPLPPHILASNTRRDSWVQRITDYVYETRHQKRYNVLTMNLEIDHHFSPENETVEELKVEYLDSAKSRKINYVIYVFRAGAVEKLGDGGYINWCMEGKFERIGTDHVDFFWKE